MQPEARLIKKVQALIRQKGGRSFKIHGGDPLQEAGIPDLLVCYRGRFVGLEGKQPGAKPSRRQKQVLDEIAAAGGITAVVTTVEEVVALLAKLEKEADR